MLESGTGIAILDAIAANYPIVYCNETFEQMGGYSRGELLGRSCPLFDEATTDPLSLGPVWKGLEGEGDYRVVLKSCRKNGQVFWLDLTLSSVRDSGGRCIQYVIAAREICDRIDPAFLYRTLAENLPHSAVLWFDLNLHLLSMEGPELAQWQLLRETAGGQLLTDVLPLDIAEAIAPYCLATVAGKATNSEIILGDRIYSLKTIPFHNEPEKMGAGMAILQNITESKHSLQNLQKLEAIYQVKVAEITQAKQELKQARSQLVQSEKMSALGHLLAGVAHEINNPVNFITGNLEHASQYIEDLLGLVLVYQQKYPNPTPEIIDCSQSIDLEFLMEDLPKLVSSMQLGAGRIREIVLSLRNFSRMDESAVNAIDIHECLNSTLLILQNRLKGRSNHTEIQLVKSYDWVPLVECYPGQINQVFMNLVSNAIDALDEWNEGRSPQEMESSPGVIALKTAFLPGCSSSLNSRGTPAILSDSPLISVDSVLITIADNGPGIPEAVKSQLFTPFVTTKPVGKGTGLGLSISYHIVVEKHGGKLLCTSEPGKGTEFAIVIPLQQLSPAVGISQWSNSGADG